MRNEKGQFSKGVGFWTGKKRPGFKNSTTFKKGIKHSKESIEKMLQTRKGKYERENSPNWRGGITPLQFLIRNSFPYRDWRSNVLKRDKYTCQECGDTKKLNVHHKKSFSEIRFENKIFTIEEAIKCIELWDISNGITLCESCHIKTDTCRGSRKKIIIS
tara:strand:- start:1872 stop:2351 length:480 start_codon:yes stop_codon:yes gene_type:complete